MGKPLVSICCLVYNHSAYLRECLDGFVKQRTNFPVEILIHDDASTDNSREIIQEFIDKNPDLFVPIFQSENQFSKGGGILAKFVFPLVQGKYIALCEGDDYWTDPLKLQKQVDFLENHYDFSMCFHAAITVREVQVPNMHFFNCIEEREYSSTEVFSRWTVPTASIMFRKDPVMQYKVRHSEWLTRGDIDLVLRCSHTGKIWGMKDVMSVYRMQPESVSHNPKYRGAEVYRLPKHFRCLLINYPLVDPSPIKWNISHAYYSRMKVQRSLWKKIVDFFLFCYWDPKQAFVKVRSLIYRH